MKKSICGPFALCVMLLVPTSAQADPSQVGGSPVSIGDLMQMAQGQRQRQPVNNTGTINALKEVAGAAVVEVWCSEDAPVAGGDITDVKQIFSRSIVNSAGAVVVSQVKEAPKGEAPEQCIATIFSGGSTEYIEFDSREQFWAIARDVSEEVGEVNIAKLKEELEVAEQQLAALKDSINDKASVDAPGAAP